MAEKRGWPKWGQRRGQNDGANPSQAEEGSDATGTVEPDTVVGERPVIPSVSRAQSIQSRVNTIVAVSAAALIGGGGLAWYVSHQLTQLREAEEAAKKASASRAGGEMKLPPLPRIDPPGPVQTVLGPPPEVPKAAQEPAAPKGPSPEELELQRKLKSPVIFAGAGGNTSAAMSLPVGMPNGGGFPEGPALLNVSSTVGGLGVPMGGSGPIPVSTSTAPGGSDLSSRLQPTATPAVRAQRLPDPRYLLPKGTFVDCTLETAIDSTLPGMVTCVTAVDTFSADGQVVLLERGTHLVGETRGELKQGQARVFVLWTEARTPNGVVVALASPGTDELGRSGLPGAVDTHFWDRFGAAVLLSLIDGAVQAAVTRQRGDGGPSVIYNPQGTRDIMTEVLRNTVSIVPSVVKNQGDRIQVLVARDADFRSVYALRAAP
jgi:type IV secretion system protein VirB10